MAHLSDVKNIVLEAANPESGGFSQFVKGGVKYGLNKLAGGIV